MTQHTQIGLGLGAGGELIVQEGPIFGLLRAMGEAFWSAVVPEAWNRWQRRIRNRK
jgi:hypothetical protein